MNRVLVLIIILFLFLNHQGFSQNQPCKRSTEGKEFWFGFMESRNYHSAHYIEVTVTARENTNIKITVGEDSKGNAVYSQNFSVNANSSAPLKIPWNVAEAIGSEQIQRKAIHLVSEKPVNVYALNWDQNSADVAVIYPVESLGKEYFAMCYDPAVDQNNPLTGNGRNSEFLIVASEDSTTVAFTPSKVTDMLLPKDSTFVVVLNKGDVYQVQSDNKTNTGAQGQGDLTGSHIIANKPIALYSGSLSTQVPLGKCCWDHLYEQVPPIQAWGREYYTVPLLSRQKDRYRIMAAYDNTTVYITGMAPFKLNRGEFKELEFYFNEPKKIFGDQPILVAQYSQSRDVDSAYTGGNGDPFMIILSSTTQSKNDVTFVAYNSSQIKKYYVNIITLTEEVKNIRFDGVSISGEFQPFPDNEYSFAQKAITPGTHQIVNTNKDRGFLAYVYGYGGVESYGYGVGFNLDLVLDLGKSINFSGDTLLLCNGEKRTLDAGPYFDTYQWNTGDSTQHLVISKGGQYKVRTTTIDGCDLKDSIYVFVSDPPKPDLGNDVAECYPYSKPLDAGNGYLKYEWNTGENTQLITIDKTGEYSVTVFDKYECPARDTMQLTVYPVPDIQLVSPLLVCGSYFHKIELQYSGVEESVVSNGKMVWKTDKPSKLTFSNNTNTSAEIEVSEWGDYQVFYAFTTADGCSVTDTLTLKFAEIPIAKFKFSDDSNDKCKGYTREVVYDGNATQNAHYFWNFGNSLADSINWDRWRVSLSPGNSQAHISLNLEENGCYSLDTFKLNIAANPDFVMNTVRSRGCDSATINFSGELKVQDNIRFEWNFGDGSAISNMQNPTHQYNQTGFYDVSLKITNIDNGCFIGFTESDMVKIFPTPIAKIELDSLFCNDSSVVAIYPLNIDSSFCKWSFSGGSMIGDGNDTIVVMLDQQVAKISLQVDEFGCKSKWVETTAKRKPFFDFTTDIAEGCQPLGVSGKATSSDQQINYSWLTDSVNYFGSEQLFFLPDSGMYLFSVEANSELTGCSRVITKPDLVWVHPKPVAQFEVDYPVATIEHADLHFSNQTEIVEKYNWDFGDGNGSELENPQHTYTSLGNFVTALEVTTEFGCMDTTAMEIEIIPFNVYTPNAFRPDSELEENRLFMPVGLGVDINHFNFKVFNRWGELIFESKNPENKWDGKKKNSTIAPFGNYVWKAEYIDIQGFYHSVKGQVLLIR